MNGMKENYIIKTKHVRPWSTQLVTTSSSAQQFIKEIQYSKSQLVQLLIPNAHQLLSKMQRADNLP